MKPNPMERLINGIVKENPTFVLMLGMCPTLAVTTSAINGVGMGLSTTVVLIMSNMLISMLRKIIPDSVRMPAFIVVVASFVTIVQFLMEGFTPALYDSLGIYIPLIVVNCIILGRAESYASKNPVLPSIFDGIGMGLGFTVGLVAIGLVRELLGSGVCGADLAGAEASYPMSQFMNLFENTRKIGMPFTIHAGECGSVDNITDAVNVGAKRIGHGIAMRGHEDVIRELAEKKIGIEMCPVSNLQTKAVSGPEFYPIREFLDQGVLVTVNTDNRTVSNTTMTKELEFIQKTYGIRDDEIYLLMKNAVDVAFTEEHVKDRLHRIMKEAYGA